MENIHERMIDLISDTQKKVSTEIALLDEKDFFVFPWQKSENKKGVINYFAGGKLIEKGFVNVSFTSKAPVFEQMAKFLLSEDLRANFSQYSYSVVNISSTFYPHSPLIPEFGAHCRYFEVKDKAENIVSWFFGLGSDLEPYYLFPEDVIHYHSSLKATCDKVDPALYKQLKKTTDDYFYIPHREEHVGVGGILTHKIADRPKEILYEWVCDFCKGILPSYIPIIRKRMKEPFSESQKKWQLILRSRFAELLLLYDEGVRFGLHSGIDVDTVLVSMSPLASWDSSFKPPPNSPEETMLEVLKNPREWV